MKKKTTIREKLNSKSAGGSVLPLLGIALIIFTLTVAVYFAADYVAQSYASDDMLSNWNYTYTEKAGALPSGELRVFNAQNPIITERSVRKNNIYLVKTIEASDNDRTVTIMTDFAPAKIKLNGKLIYDNRFDKESYVGNCYNSFVVRKSTHEQTIEVFLKLPFSVRFEAYISENADPAFAPSFVFRFGCGVAAAGLIAILVFAAMSLIKRRLFRSVAVGAAVFFSGAVLALNSLPEVTYLLNDPVWFKLTLLPVHLTFMVTLAFLNRLFKDRKRTLIAILFASVLSVLTVMPAPDPTLIKAASAAMCLLCLLASVYSAKAAAAQLERRTQYSVTAFVMIAYYTMMMLLAGVFLMARQRVLYRYTVAVPTLVIACVMEYIYITDYRFKLKNSKLQSETSRYGEMVDNVSLLIRDLLRCDDPERFYETAVQEIYDLLVKFNEKNASARYCAAVKTESGFVEKLNSGIEGCNYRLIEKNSLHSGKKCLFAETYFEFVLGDENGAGAVFHFENISGGMDMFFVCMLEATYCGLETTYENTVSGKRSRDINMIFEELAGNAELDNGCPEEHLENISRYVYELCLRMGLSREDAERISVASKLHDLGKIAVPKYIIHKQGLLSEDERVIVNSHTKFGYTILSAYDDDPLIADAAEIALYHHERYDGSGTNGLSGEDIPFTARVVTVCDVYDALVSEREYKKAWTPKEARAYLADNKGKLFDPEITDAFLAFLDESGDAEAGQG